MTYDEKKGKVHVTGKRVIVKEVILNRSVDIIGRTNELNKHLKEIHAGLSLR